jgi:hypothetical protein
MSTTTTWRELHPEGMTVFYEGDDPDGFVGEIKERFGFDPSEAYWWQAHRSFVCPPEHLDAIYGGETYALGS